MRLSSICVAAGAVASSSHATHPRRIHVQEATATRCHQCAELASAPLCCATTMGASCCALPLHLPARSPAQRTQCQPHGSWSPGPQQMVQSRSSDPRPVTSNAQQGKLGLRQLLDVLHWQCVSPCVMHERVEVEVTTVYQAARAHRLE